MSDPSNPLPSTPRDAPFFQAMQREMNQLLDRFRGAGAGAPADVFDVFRGPLFPAIDVVETDDAMVITAEVPGVAEDDLDISVVRDTLVIKGTKSTGTESTQGDIHVVERRHGSFRRQIALGFTPAEGAVEARFEGGVLTLTIAKPDEAESGVQRIRISRP